MTSTSVKDVSAVMNSYVPGVGSTAGVGEKASFQDVWNNQTGKNNASDAAVTDDKKVTAEVKKTGREDNLKVKENVKVDKNHSAAEKTQTDKPDEKRLEEMMEILNTAAAELMQEIAEAFGMTMEELEQLMADMNLEPLDVLNPEKLSALLLEAGGAADSLALLTDENLCAGFQMVMKRQKEMFADLSEKLQMSEAELAQLVEEMDTYALDETEERMPVITVDVEPEQAEENETLTKEMNVVSQETVVETENGVSDKTTRNGTQEQHSDGAKDQTGNLLLQNLKADSFQPEIQQTHESTSVWNETTQNIMRQIMDFMKIQVKADTSSLEMQLHPASLGTLQVQVASKGGVLTASFVAENETVKSVLENQMVQLKESFAEQGVKVEAIEVTVKSHQFESNLEQGRGRQSQEPEKKSRNRRINLNASLDMDTLEEMTGEEQLAAEIMTANGNTVDYTA